MKLLMPAYQTSFADLIKNRKSIFERLMAHHTRYSLGWNVDRISKFLEIDEEKTLDILERESFRLETFKKSSFAYLNDEEAFTVMLACWQEETVRKYVVSGFFKQVSVAWEACDFEQLIRVVLRYGITLSSEVLSALLDTSCIVRRYDAKDN